jgi:hypothetical protein
LSLFSELEVATLKSVAGELAGLSSRQLAERSHVERAYRETPSMAMISYRWADELSL